MADKFFAGVEWNPENGRTGEPVYVVDEVTAPSVVVIGRNRRGKDTGIIILNPFGVLSHTPSRAKKKHRAGG
jgi:hypothetical protein